MIKQYGLPVPLKLKAILFASESIYRWEWEVTKEIFNFRIFIHYGMAEKVVLAGECENTHNYNCLPQYSITEIDANTNEIIGTSLLNYVNPFIRYSTTDIATATLSNYSTCNECDRKYYPFLEALRKD